MGRLGKNFPPHIPPKHPHAEVKKLGIFDVYTTYIIHVVVWMFIMYVFVYVLGLVFFSSSFTFLLVQSSSTSSLPSMSSSSSSGRQTPYYFYFLILNIQIFNTELNACVRCIQFSCLRIFYVLSSK